MEQNFIERSKHEFEKFVDEATEDLRNTFESRYKRIDGMTALFVWLNLKNKQINEKT